MLYINFNGNIYPENEPLIPVSNRGFRYGDGFFESMVMFNKQIPLLDSHFYRIESTAEVLQAALPKRFNVEKFESKVLDLASANGGWLNARVRVQFYRKGKGLYLPDEDELGYAISMEPITNSKFECTDGLTVGVADECYKPSSIISDLKNSSALPFVFFAQRANAENWDEIILLNSSAQLCEAIHSNVFLVKGSKLVTPDLQSGCVNGVMRAFICSMLEQNIDEREVEAKELMEADEVLLVNAVKGVQWVKNFETKTYTNRVAVQLVNELNMKLSLNS